LTVESLGAAVRERLAVVRVQIAAAARAAGRDPGRIGIVAVTKTLPPEAVLAALAAGLGDIGENYVQEGRLKRLAVEGRGTWHLVGGLQRNKIRSAVAVFDRLHSLDSDALAVSLGAVLVDARRRLPVLIQVNLRDEPTKRGVAPDGVLALAKMVARQPGLALEGLMAVPPPDATPEASRPYFRLLREVRDHTARGLGVELPHLSMGMSGDFTVAVEEGATWLRLGRALFGARGPGAWRPGSSAGGQGS
jgi:PLP dependent protein